MGFSPGTVKDGRKHSVADMSIEVSSGFIELLICDEVNCKLICLNAIEARKLISYLEITADMLEKGNY